MKKILFAVWAFIVCLNLQADPISAERARTIAARFAANADSPRLVHKAARRSPARAGSHSAADAPLYIYSRGEGQGFVIVSGDDCLPEVLAIVEQGDWDEAALPPTLLEWVDGYADLIEAAQAQQRPARQPRQAAGTRTIPALCQTHWNQSWPYNNRCPWRKDDPNSRCLTGCVATAASQVVYYWHRDNPSRSGYATPTYGYGSPVTESVPKNTPLRWDLMQTSYGGNTPAEMQSAVADLMFITGASTWLTYGSSTSGQISDLVNTLNGQYNLSSTCWYKSGNSQDYWEKIIIDDLEAGRPIVYSGVHPTNGGHAVVLDGYNHTNNLFHFNFGWGGQGDGWYTVDDQTGMNGFNSQQGMTFRIHPKAYNVAGKILNVKQGDTFAQRVDNTIRVSFTNHSTVPQTGIYLFCLTGNNKPSSIDKATRKDESTVVPVDGTGVTEFTFKPTLATSVYTIYLTDANCTVLDKVEHVSVAATTPDLTLQALSVNGAATATETISVDGSPQQVTVATVFNTSATVTASLSNSAQATLCQPSLTCQLDTYDATAGFAKSTTKSHSDTQFTPAGTEEVTFAFTRLKENVLYRATLVPTSTVPIAGSDAQAVYFRIQPADLAIAAATDDEVTLTGHWNDEAFASLATTPSAVRYDLTAVQGNVSHPQASNPNALFYVGSNSVAKGQNIVQDGICQQLVVEPGYRFAPKEAFKAKQASMHIRTGIAAWNLLCIPFQAEVPTGAFARRVNDYNSSGAVNKADSVSSPIAAGAEHLLMSSVDELTLAGTDCTIQPTPLDVLCTTSVKVSTIYTTKDTQNKKLAEAIGEAELRIPDIQATADPEAMRQLSATIAQAKACFTAQPYREQIKAMTATLSDALEQAEATHLDFTADGKVNLTSLIQNPSFESGTSKWTIKKPTGVSSTAQNITTSQANYMAGADGERVLYLSYKQGADNAYFFQTLDNVPEGIYELQADLASDRDCQVCLFAGTDTVRVAATDFGPFYFTTVSIKNIRVADGTLTIGAQTVDGWLKADNFRLYQTEGMLTGIDAAAATTPHATRQAYDLQGRPVPAAALRQGQPKGIYIVGGRKKVVR